MGDSTCTACDVKWEFTICITVFKKIRINNSTTPCETQHTRCAGDNLEKYRTFNFLSKEEYSLKLITLALQLQDSIMPVNGSG